MWIVGETQGLGLQSEKLGCEKVLQILQTIYDKEIDIFPV